MGEPLSVTLKRVNVLDLKRWLDIPLPAGKLNRSRNEFLALIKSQLDDIEVQRLAILKQYAKKDKDGNQSLTAPDFENEADHKKAEDEYQDMMKEPVTLIIDKPMALEVVRSILGSSTAKFGAEEGARFEEVCQVMGVEFKDEEKPKSSIIV